MTSEYPDFEKMYDEHAALVGHVTLAWSNVHSQVFRIFALLCDPIGKRSEAVFFALKSDASQREITLAVINETLSEPLRKRARVIFGRINRLAGERNLAAHTMWATLMPTGRVIPNPSVRKPPRLEDDFERQFQALNGKLRELFRELMQFNHDAADEMNKRGVPNA
jgi:hypothetical protein